MTSEQIAQVKDSWRQAAATTPPVAELFYAKLSEIDPALKALFLNDSQAQQKKFSDTLSVIVEHLDNPVALVPKIHELGVSHAGYGVKDEHYAMVEQALIGALKQSLGGEFDAATEQAWTLAYRALADGMTSADIDSDMYPR